MLLAAPLNVLSAEVFQVSSYSSLKVGDQNRIYKVEIGCLNIDPENEDIAFDWLRSELPRHARVNLQPIGYSDGTLISRVIKINSNNDIAKLMIEKGFAKNKCSE